MNENDKTSPEPDSSTSSEQMEEVNPNERGFVEEPADQNDDESGAEE